MTPLPATLKPELATLVARPPAGDDWLYEIKFDGYRLLARIERRAIQLFTRNGNDWTARLRPLEHELRALKLPDGWYDGEIVVLNDEGKPNFNLLQLAFDNSKTRSIIYYLFDLPYCDGEDLRGLPLVERRARLAKVLGHGSDAVRFSAALEGDIRDLVGSACQMGLEGIIGKRKGSRYVTRRSDDWIKLKCSLRQEFVVGGFTEPSGSRSGFGSLLLGVFDKSGALQYAGKVGTGFDTELLVELRSKLDTLETKKRPFPASTKIPEKGIHWVEPKLLVEVSFGEWTAAGHIRHSTFRGLREDKPARQVRREGPSQAPSRTAPSTLPDKFTVTNADRVIDTSSDIQKVDLVTYYAQVAELIFEHLKGRPVSMVRAPTGIQGELFFQRHLEGRMEGIRSLPETLRPGHESMMEVAKPLGVLSAAQMNVIELHTWNAVRTSIGKPDRMIFDIDPGESVQWSEIQEAALMMRALLEQLELMAFVKTSGGKGFHVVVPLQRRHDWDTVKDFSQAIVQHLAQTFPKRFTAKSGPRNRVKKIFIDYLRNGWSATTVCAWSARARPGMGVSVPIGWDEVETLERSDYWTVPNMKERLTIGNAPWGDYAKSARPLSPAMRIFGFNAA